MRCLGRAALLALLAVACQATPLPKPPPDAAPPSAEVLAEQAAQRKMDTLIKKVEDLEARVRDAGYPLPPDAAP